MLQPARSDLLPPEKGAGVTLWYVAMKAGLLDWSAERLVRHVRLLHAQEGFPPPLPSFRSGARRRGICLTSRWLRDAVDAWFDGQLPPEAIAPANDLRRRRDAETLDQRAAQLAAA